MHYDILRERVGLDNSSKHDKYVLDEFLPAKMLTFDYLISLRQYLFSTMHTAIWDP